MRVDRDDRYVSEQPKKDYTPSFKLPSFLEGFSKTKLIILAVAAAVILLLLCLIIFRSSHKPEPTPLTPPAVNEVSSTDNSHSGVGGNSETNGVATASEDPWANREEPAASTSSSPAPTSTSTAETPISPAPNSSSALNQRPQAFPDDIGDEMGTDSNPPSVAPEVIKPKSVTPPKQPKPQKVTSPSPVKVSEAPKPKTSAPPVVKDKVVHSAANNVSSTSTAMPAKMTNNHFAIQLNASSSEASLKSFVKQNQITNYQIYETKRDNKPWFVLIKGSYTSSNEAREAIKSLPSVLQKNNPWIKSGATINKEKSEK